jgi:hypothetical protein
MLPTNEELDKRARDRETQKVIGKIILCLKTITVSGVVVLAIQIVGGML